MNRCKPICRENACMSRRCEDVKTGCNSIGVEQRGAEGILEAVDPGLGLGAFGSEWLMHPAGYLGHHPHSATDSHCPTITTNHNHHQHNMATINAETEGAPQVVFRPGKKRKNYRQRAEEPEITTSNGETPEAGLATPSSAPATPAGLDDDDEGLSVAGVIRARNARKHRHGGVGFRAGPLGLGDNRATSEEHNTDQRLVLHGNADAQAGAEAAVIGGISKRFAPQTGMVGELVNKHM